MKSVAMIGIKDSYKIWAVEFDSGSAILDWQDANPDFEVHSWAPVVALEAALGYAKGDAEGETVRSQNSRTEREEKASVAYRPRPRTKSVNPCLNHPLSGFESSRPNRIQFT